MALTLSTRLPATAIGTSQEPFAPLESATTSATCITSSSAVTTANLIGGYGVPAGTTGQCLYRQLGAGSSLKIMPLIGHASTPAAKTATLYLVLGHEIKPKSPALANTYMRTVVGSLALTGAASGGNLTPTHLAQLADTLATGVGGFAAWVGCDIVATSYHAGAGVEVVGSGNTPNFQMATLDAYGAAFLEVWGVNGAASQGVAVFVAQC